MVASHASRNSVGDVYSCGQRKFIGLVDKDIEVGVDKKGHARQCSKSHNDYD